MIFLKIFLLISFSNFIIYSLSEDLKDVTEAPDGGERHGKEKQIVVTYATAMYQAYQYLVRDGNSGIMDGKDQPFYYTQPSPYKYGSSQWLWDSSAAIVTNSNRDIELAKLELRTLLAGQLPDGKIAEMTDWPSGSVNQLTQMPTVVYALQVVYERSQDKDLLRELLPKVVAYHNWWRRTRDLDHNGLVTTIHPWESGLDASPAFDEAWHFEPMGDPVRDWLRLYPQFEELETVYKDDYNWNVTEILARPKAPTSLRANWFVVQDVGMNVLHAAGWAILGDLSRELGDEVSANIYYEYNTYAENAIKKYMWDSEIRQFCTTYRDSDGVFKKSTVQSIQTLFPLLMRTITSDQVQAVVEDILNPNKFWSNYPFPTVSLMEPSYTGKYTTNLMWRGPTWGFTNWFVLKGLSLQNQNDIISIAVDRWMNALINGVGVWEMWNAETGIGYGAEGLGMSTLFVDWFYYTGKVVRNVNDFSGILPNSPNQLWNSNYAISGDSYNTSSNTMFDDTIWVLSYGTNAIINKIELYGDSKSLQKILISYGDKRSTDSYNSIHGSVNSDVKMSSINIEANDYVTNVLICSEKGILNYAKFTTSLGKVVEMGTLNQNCNNLYCPNSIQQVIGFRSIANSSSNSFKDFGISCFNRFLIDSSTGTDVVDSSNSTKSSTSRLYLIIGCSVGAFFVVCFILIFWIRSRKNINTNEDIKEKLLV